MNIRKIDIESVRNIWEDFEALNNSISPYQYYDIFKIIYSNYLFFTISKLEKPELFAIFDGNSPVMIVPLCRKFCGGDIKYVSFGCSTTIAFQDFIYPESMDEGTFSKCLELITKKFGKIKLCNVGENTMLYRYLVDHGVCLTDNTNVNIRAPLEYAEYFNTLSKSARQNIRTSYNRMNTDGLSYSLEQYSGGKGLDSIIKDVMDVYISRRNERYKMASKIHELFLRKYHYNTIAFSCVDESLCFVLKIGDEVAAFWEGYIYRDSRSVLVPRLAINEKFGKYSPGTILICETLKILKPELGIDNFDLSKGDEQYKYTMGGETYFTHDFLLS